MHIDQSEYHFGTSLYPLGVDNIRYFFHLIFGKGFIYFSTAYVLFRFLEQFRTQGFRRREPGRDVKIRSDRMLRIKGSAENSRWTCVDRPSCSFFSFSFFFNLTYSRWTSSLPSCLWSLRIFPSLPGSRLTIFYRDASSALLQLVNQWLNFTYSRSHAFRYERKNTNPTLVRIELTTFCR